MTTPYLSPAELVNLPTGVQWQSIPGAKASAAEQTAAQLLLLSGASQWCDAQCGMPLRATSDQEEFAAPGPYATADRWGVLTIAPRRWPVLSVTTLEVRPSYGRTTDYVALDADDITLETNAGAAELASGAGTRRIRVLASGIVKGTPRGAWSLRLTYVNGWPHSELATAVSSAATTLTVLDGTGFAAGQTVTLSDGAQSEDATISAVSGMTLTVPALAYKHAAGVVVTALPAPVRLACGYYAAHIALRRGSQATALPPVHQVRTTRQATETDYLQLALDHLAPYRRLW